MWIATTTNVMLELCTKIFTAFQIAVVVETSGGNRVNLIIDNNSNCPIIAK